MLCRGPRPSVRPRTKKRPRRAASKRGDTGRDRQGRPAVAGWALSRCARQSKRCRTTWKRIEPKVSRLFGLSRLIVPLDLLPRHAPPKNFFGGGFVARKQLWFRSRLPETERRPLGRPSALSDSPQFPLETVRSLPGIK